MAKSSMQKLKLLYLRQFLLENSDENHPVTVNDMIEYLSSLGIKAERKSIYDDIEQLTYFGDDVISVKQNRSVGYYVAGRQFEVSELKLLVDAVQGSKFITQKKSASLIKKLEGLCSRFEAQSLSRQVLITDRIKSMNESIYYNVDKIHNAITLDKSISFKYFDYNLEKERVLKHDGKLYNVSPFALNWDDENYYLIGFDNDICKIRHYRVDKMLDIEVTQAKRLGRDEFEKTDVQKYSKKVFSMFGGEEQSVCIEFSNDLCGAVIDRFGKDTLFRKSENEGKFYVYTNVVVSSHFYGWVFSFGEKAKIVTPQNIANDFIDYTQKVISQYN